MKKTILLIVFGLLSIGGYFVYQMLYPTPIKTNPIPSPKGSSTPEPIKYSLAQIAQHSTRDSCWLAIEGNVYDVTPFVASGFHPGKDAILQGCGKDATVLFNTRPMGNGTPHSERARQMLPKYLIGILEG